MAVARLSRSTLFLPLLLLALLWPSGLDARPLADDDVVVIVQTGKNSDGSGRFEVADSSDPRANQLWKMSQNDSGMRKTLDYYRQVQSPSSYMNLTAEERQALSVYSRRDPIYLEVKESSGGAYCDWKAKFTVRMPTGEVRSVASPKVVIKRNDPVFTGSNTSLQAQTVVHEMGHAAMAKLYGAQRLPYTEWLHKEHAGGTISDQKLALIEGWAEFVGAYYTGRHTIANDPAGSMDDNRYVYTSISSMNTVRSASDLMKTEGWVATALLKLVESGTVSIDDLNGVFADSAPATFPQLLEGLEKARPDKVSEIRDVLAETSRGRMFPDRYQAPQGTTEPTRTASRTTSRTVTNYDPPSSSRSYGPVTYAPGSGVSGFSVGGLGGTTLIGVLGGAAVGAIIGFQFGGVVGAVVGGLALGVVGGFVANMIDANHDSAARPTTSPAAAAPAVVGAPTVSSDDERTGDIQEKLATMRQKVREAFKRYMEATRTGTRKTKEQTLEAYRKLQSGYAKLRKRLSGSAQKGANPAADQ